MKFLVCMNAFKSTMTSKTLNNQIKRFLESHGHEVMTQNISDGGDGFLDALKSSFAYESLYIESVDPLDRPINIEVIRIENVVYVESALAIGLSLLDKSEQNPLNTTTYGLGLVIKKLYEMNHKDIVIGLGGSATNDGGLGALCALGLNIYDQKGFMKKQVGQSLNEVQMIDASHLNKTYQDLQLTLVTDVDNLLLGKDGATRTYAKQKGATDEAIEKLESGMHHFKDLIENHVHKDIPDKPMMGAAGGIPFGLTSFFNVNLKQGTSYMIDKLKIDAKMKDFNIVIVGEGRLDNQTLHHKAPYDIGVLAQKHEKHVIGIFGSSTLEETPNFINDLYVLAKTPEEIQKSIKKPKESLDLLLKSLIL